MEERFLKSENNDDNKMRRAEYKFPQAVPEEPQQDKRMPDQEQDSIVVAAKTVRISLSGQQQRKQQPVAL